MYVCVCVHVRICVCTCCLCMYGCVHVKFLLTGTPIIGTIHLTTTITPSLATSPSLPGQSQVHVQRRESSKLKIFTDKSDHTETIRFKFSHNSGGCKQAIHVSDQPSESI